MTERRGKYNARPTKMDDHRFDSKREAERYQELKQSDSVLIDVLAAVDTIFKFSNRNSRNRYFIGVFVPNTVHRRRRFLVDDVDAGIRIE